MMVRALRAAAVAGIATACLALAACGGKDGGDTATSPGTAGQVGMDPLDPLPQAREGSRELDGSRVRETAESYCGGTGRIGDLARMVGLHARTESLNRIAMGYGKELAHNAGDQTGGPGKRASIRQAAYEGCLAGLRRKRIRQAS